MEPVARKRGRPRKRRNEGAADKEGPERKKQVVEAVPIVPIAFVGRYVLKEFKGNGIFLGKVVYYDTGLYRVEYEDGDCEDLDSGELRMIALEENYFDDELIARRKKLDGLVLKSSARSRNRLQKKVVGSTKEVKSESMSELSDKPTMEDGEQVDGDVDSSSDSCEDSCDRDLEPEVPPIPPPQLPLSSGTIGVPEEFVSHLFSVYGFLRSYSICLFLSPFALDELVGSLNCSAPNYLLDAIHVALMRVLRRHLEVLSSEGSELASKCLRCIDWSLLDALTWPFYLVQYLTVMGRATGPEWKGFYIDVLEREYYSLPACRKLMILQILCDDVLDSAEIRAELDMREESEVGIDSDPGVTNLPANVPRRVHPKYSKTSACKDSEAMDIITKNHEMQVSHVPGSLGFKGREIDNSVNEVDMDANGDECRLCGMDGTLLCCDGCPSAYHSRCVGVIKMYMPEGSWYCPECTISKTEPAVTTGTSLKGAQIFGVDSYEQVFLGTCNHLLVLGASIDKKSGLRYYNQNDIPKVLQALYSSVQHKILYAGICNSIMQYWNISESILSLPEENVHDAAMSTPSLHTSSMEKHAVRDTVKAEKCAIGVNEDDEALSLPQTSDSVVQTKCHTTAIQVNAHDSQKHSDLIRIESAASVGSVSQQAGPSDLTQQSLAGRSSSAIDLAACTPGFSRSYAGHVNDSCLTDNISSQSKLMNHSVFRNGDRISSNDRTFVYMGSSFKPQAYINQYMHGDFAASAAANLAILSSEEKRPSDVLAFSNPRKAVSANISLQAKAFSLTAVRFFWPSSEKKLFEVPRERCGWCYSCKASGASKRGCMLNAASLSITKGAMKFLAGPRSVKSGEGVLPSIIMYTLYMEESLCGLLVGSFRCENYRKQWRKQMEQASTCSKIKSLLLELERNIRIIAFSGDWVKLVDNMLVDSAAVQNATCTTGSVQKRGPGGRRGRKPSALTSDKADGCHDKSFCWWRGGKLSKLIFQKGILPKSLIKKAARQGGLRKISGIYYTDGPEVPKRSRQLVWRAAVEASRNASQLAFQVRYLDIHVRWSDLVRSEISLPDGKGPETEASAFRNAIVCDKKIVENKTRYGVNFTNQKHLPSRVLKNIIETEQKEDGKETYWFLETRIPLYLIKEYEEKSKSSEQVLLPSAKNGLNVLSSLQRRQLKASRKDIFSFLKRKRDNMEACFCASCQQDVLLRNAAKCSACEGYCHKDCTVNSPVSANDVFQLVIICKKCYRVTDLVQNTRPKLAGPLALQGQHHHNAVAAPKDTKQKGYSQPLALVGTRESSSEVKLAAPIRNRDNSSAVKQTPARIRGTCSEVKQTPIRIRITCSEVKPATSDSKPVTKSKPKNRTWGIIWKKPGVKDDGIEFRRQNIISRDMTDRRLLEPVCHSCHKPYNSDLTYIHCVTCQNWFHAAALEVDDSKLCDVVGFKCCRCRRIAQPSCPFKNPDDKKPESHRPGGRKSDSVSRKLGERVIKQELSGVDSGSRKSGERVDIKQELSGVDSVSGTTSEVKEWEPATPMFPPEEFIKEEEVFLKQEDPFLTSLSRVEPIIDPNSEVGLEWNAASHSGPQKLPVRRHGKREGDVDGVSWNDLSHAELPADPNGNSFSPGLDWNAPIDGFEGDMMFDYDELNYEDMEFEPQTYFSFTELLPVEDGAAQLDGAIDASADASQQLWDISSGANSREQPEPEVPVESTVNVIQCRMCSHTEPVPDLSCEICGLQIHSHCSPWDESLHSEGSWSCGSCREWR